MANRTKIVVARVYPKPGLLQQVIDVYAPIVPLVHQEPGCELFALHTDGETVFVVEKWATPADLQGHAAGPAYAQIRAGISDLVDHAADVWVLDNLPFGETAKGTIPSTGWAARKRSQPPPCFWPPMRPASWPAPNSASTAAWHRSNHRGDPIYRTKACSPRPTPACPGCGGLIPRTLLISA
jgi:quinol monooxygenase YgiN